MMMAVVDRGTPTIVQLEYSTVPRLHTTVSYAYFICIQCASIQKATVLVVSWYYPTGLVRLPPEIRSLQYPPVKTANSCFSTRYSVEVQNKYNCTSTLRTRVQARGSTFLRA